MLELPPEITQTGFHDAPLKFAQVATMFDSSFIRRQPKVAGWMLACTNQAMLAFSAAMVEWAAWRLQSAWDAEVLLQLAERMWQAQLDPSVVESDKPDRTGKTFETHFVWATWSSGNAQRKMVAAKNGKQQLCQELANAALYVAPKKKVMTDWMMSALERLHDAHPC